MGAEEMGSEEMGAEEEVEEMSEMPMEGVEVVSEMEEMEEMKEGVEVVSEMEEIEEGAEIVSEETIEVDGDEAEISEATLNEDLEEPIEGESPAQDSEARFNDGMEKDNHVKEGVNTPGAGLLSEGFTATKKTALNEELERMKRLAKI